MSEWQNNKEVRRAAYVEKLKDPRWQKLRLQVFERDQWVCQLCFNDAQTLNVHHLYYESGREPWDYPLNALTTLCETCHTDETEDRPQQEKDFLFQLKKKGFMAWDLERMAVGFAALPDGLVFTPVPDIIAYSIADYGTREMIQDRYFAHLAEMLEAKKQSKDKTE